MITPNGGLGYSVSVLREAEELYVSGLSCRAVARELRRRHGHAPSQEWVCQRMRDQGVLRSKSRANELREARRNGVDYDRLRPVAVAMAKRMLSVREISRRLGVSRNAVKRWIPDELLANASEATTRRNWEAALPDVDRRIERRADVLEMSAAGATYREIQEATGASRSTIYKYRREAGLVTPLTGRRRPEEDDGE